MGEAITGRVAGAIGQAWKADRAAAIHVRLVVIAHGIRACRRQVWPKRGVDRAEIDWRGRERISNHTIARTGERDESDEFRPNHNDILPAPPDHG